MQTDQKSLEIPRHLLPESKLKAKGRVSNWRTTRHFPERTEKAVTFYVKRQPTTKLQPMCKHGYHGSMQTNKPFRRISGNYHFAARKEGKDYGATTFAVMVK